MTFEYTRVPVKVRDWAESHRRNSQAINYLLALSSDFQTPLTTKGDIMGFDTASTRLAVGSDTQVLTADSAEATGLKWAAPTPLTTAGDILGHNGTSLVRRAVGTNGQVLTAVSANPDKLGWTTPFSDPLTTKGDIIGRTSGATTRLGVGTDGQVLTADSTAGHGISWQTPSGGGGGGGADWVFLEEIDLSSGSTKTSTTIPDRSEILVVYNQFSHSSASAQRLDVTLNGTVTYEGQGVNYGGSATNWNTTSSINAYTVPGANDFEGYIHFKKWDTRDWYTVEMLMWSGALSGSRGGGGTVKVTAGTFNTLTFAPTAGAFDNGTLQIFYKPTTTAPEGWNFFEELTLSGTSTVSSTLPTFTDLLILGESIVTTASDNFRCHPSGTITYSGGGFNNASAVTNWTATTGISTHSSSTTREYMLELKKWGNSKNWWSVRGFFADGGTANHHSLEGLIKLTAGSFTTLTFTRASAGTLSGNIQIFYR